MSAAEARDTRIPVPRLTLHALAKNWWLVLLRGIAAVVFGILALAWPGITLLTLVLFWGAYALIDGILAIGAAIGGGSGIAPRWWLAIVGVAGIVVGLLTFFWPGVTAVMLLMFIAAWAVVGGIFEIIGAIPLRKEIDNEWLLILSGALSILVGLALFARPGVGALALIWLIGIYSIVLGIVYTVFSFRLRNHRHEAA